MPAADVEQLFRSSSRGLSELLREHAGYVIPSYQRAYAWEPAHLRRFFESLLNGLGRLVDDGAAVTFVGAIIIVSDGTEPEALPGSAVQVIDGQQRLTTTIMIAVACHEALGRTLKYARAQVAATQLPEAAWLVEQIEELRHTIAQCLAAERVTGDDGYKLLPKLVRETADVWSNRKATARYMSPVANFLHTYLVRDDAATKRFVVPEPTVTLASAPAGSTQSDHALLARRFKLIQRLVKETASGSTSELAESIDLDELLAGNNSQLLASLFDAGSVAHASGLHSLSVDSALAEALRLLIFGRFLVDRVALTKIHAKDEGYAFDLFDSLNSTGAPLTAWETFVPLVVEAEGRVAYANSPASNDVGLVGGRLQGTDNVQRETAGYLTTALLAESGAKVPARVVDQRYALNHHYQLATTQSARRGILRQLAHTAVTYFDVWQQRPTSSALPTTDSDAEFGLEFLRAINHSIVIAPLARYYADYSDSQVPDPTDWNKAIRACFAFSVLWRAARGGTAGIDGRYRTIMASGVQGVITPLARTSIQDLSGRAVPSSDDLRAGFRAMLDAEGIGTQTGWIEETWARPVYEDQRLIARVLLLTAGHRQVADGASGLTKAGFQSEVTDMLRPDRWSDDKFATIEHVAPQIRTADGSWADDVYDHAQITHRIGNLTLVPLADNSTLSNRSWIQKRYLYEAFSASSPDDAKKVLQEADAANVALPQDLQDSVATDRLDLPLLRAVADYSGQWDSAFIETRSKHLLSCAWTVLAAWL